MIIPGPVRRHDARLSRAVTLKDRNASREIRIRERGGKRRATRDEVPQTPTDTRTPLRKHQLAREPLLDTQLRRDKLSLVLQFTISLSDCERTHEDRSLVSLLGHALLDDPVIDLLKQSRHRSHHGRRNFAQVLPNLIERRRVVNRHAAITENVKTIALEDVRERQH